MAEMQVAGITIEASGALNASGALIVDNNYYALIELLKDSIEWDRRNKK